MLNNKDFGTKIADLRKKKGLTQAQLAEILNISNKTVSRWETGEGYPEITLLSPLARALSVSLDELLAEPTEERGGEDNADPCTNDYKARQVRGSKKKKAQGDSRRMASIKFQDLFKNTDGNNKCFTDSVLHYIYHGCFFML